jgi:hypothetical protein
MRLASRADMMLSSSSLVSEMNRSMSRTCSASSSSSSAASPCSTSVSGGSSRPGSRSARGLDQLDLAQADQRARQAQADACRRRRSSRGAPAGSRGPTCALRAVAQRVVHHHQRQQGLGDRRGADAHAGVVAALVTTPPARRAVDRWPAPDRAGGLDGDGVHHQVLPAADAAQHAAGVVAGKARRGAVRRRARCPCCATTPKPSPISTPLTAFRPIIA